MLGVLLGGLSSYIILNDKDVYNNGKELLNNSNNFIKEIISIQKNRYNMSGYMNKFIIILTIINSSYIIYDIYLKYNNKNNIE